MIPPVRRLLVVLLVALTVSAAFLVAVPAASAAPAVPALRPASGFRSTTPAAALDVDPTLVDFAQNPVGDKPYWDKMTPSIQDAALEAARTVNVAILTDDVNALGAFLRSAGVDTKIGSVPSTNADLRVVRIELPSGILEKVAALESVYVVAPAFLPEAPEAVDPDLPIPEGMEAVPDLIEAGKGHKVPDAWALGVTGAGVRVAVMDSGIDFGHPDLQGTYADVTDPGSPYFGWPIVFDPYSMYLWMLFGSRFAGSGYSWYADTTFNTTADPVTGLIDTPFLGRVYNVSGIPSASGVYHLGLHPDRTLRFSSTYGYNRYVGLLVTDSVSPGVYDAIYVDLDNDNRFWDDKPAGSGSPEIWADYYDPGTLTWDNSSYATGDGIADMSGGMVYFIADGANPVPYSDVIASRYSIPLPIPSNGELVALTMGDTRALGGGDHGTFCASSVVAQNVTGRVLGFAPGAKMITVGNIYAGGFFDDIWTFVGEGYDAMPGTGDEAMVASASFGSGTVNDDGWNFESRWVEMHAISYFYTAYVASSGNGGHGFGTVNTPGGSNGVISVGASTSYNAALGSFDTAAHSTFGDVQPWSDRGPSALGKGRPDIVTVGAWASGDGALNSFGGRTSPWAVWGGTSLSAPATMGILALINEAWTINPFAGGSPPDNILMKGFLLSGADNIHYDGQVMGHGIANAVRSVEGALFMDGVLPFDFSVGFPSFSWAAGDYRGSVYPSFTRLMFPGQTNTTMYTVYNLNVSTPKDVTISDWELQKIGSDTFVVAAANAIESAPNFLRPDYLIDLTSLVPPGTALLKATVSFPKAQLDWNNDYNYDSRWRVLLYDWLDYNGNGTFWNDTNGNGAVNAGEMDETMGMEVMRFTYGYPSHTNVQGFVHDPLARIHDGLLLGIQHRTVSASIPSTTLTVTVDYYAALDAPWLSTDVASATIPAGLGALGLGLNVTLPAGQPLGTLSAFVTIANGSRETQIPVIVNVAADGTLFSFGGDPSSGAFLDTNRVFGGIDWTSRSESGDWRFVYTDIPDSTPIAPGDTMIVHTWWENLPTDIDTLVFGPTPDIFTPSGFWGPYTLSTVGASSDQRIGTGIWRFQTASGVNEEWVAAPLSTGLHEIALHNVLYAGLGPSEMFAGEVGTFGVTPSPWFVFTDDAVGTGTFDTLATLDLPGLEVRSYGIAAPMSGPVFVADQATYSETFSATSIGYIDVRTTGPGGNDIDLYLDRWTGAVWQQVGSSAGPTQDERVFLREPVSGTYRIRVFGFSVPSGGDWFDLYRAVVAGTELAPSYVPTDPIPAGTPSSFNVTHTIDASTLPGFYLGVMYAGPEGAPAVQIDALFFLSDTKAPTILSTDPAWGDSVSDTTPTITVSYVDEPISAGIAFVGFVIDGLSLPIGTFNSTTFVWSFPFALGEGVHTANVTVWDSWGMFATYEWTFIVDTVGPPLTVTSPSYTLTRVAAATVAGATEPGATLTVNGSPVPVAPDGSFSTTVTLAEGGNTIVVVAADAAGNSATAVRSVTLDTTPPALSVTAPLAGATITSNIVTVTGATDVGADVVVNGVRVAPNAAGAFSVDLAFSDGTHTIRTTASDTAGNSATDTRSVTVDTRAPSITLTSPTATLTSASSVVVAGSVDDTSASVTVNGSPVSLGPGGLFSTSVGLSEGANTITVVATDPAGLSSSVSRSVTRDSTAPSLAVTSPAPGAILTSRVVTVTGTAEVGTSVVVNGIRVATNATGAFSLDLAFADGTHAIATTATDAAGNSASDARSITVDTTPPSITLTSPTATLTSASAVLVEGVVDDAAASVKVNGSPVTVAPDGSFNATVALAEGANSIVVVATDAAGLSGSATRSVTRDSTAPALTVSTPTASDVLGTSAVRVAGTTEVGVELTVNGIRIVVGTGGAWSVDLSLADGSRTITTVATDAAGNSAQDVRSVTVDTVAPTVTLTAPTAPYATSASVVVTGLVSEAADVLVNGVTATVAGGTFTATLSLSDGLRAIAVVATDAAGNVGTASTAILVDTAAPILTVSGPANGAETETPTILVSGTVSDPDTTVLVNGQRIRPEASGAWSVMVALTEGLNTIDISAVDEAGNEATVVSRTVTYTSPVPDLETDITGNTQAINNLGGQTTMGLIGLLVALIAAQIAFYWILNRKIEGMKAGKPEETPPPPEMKGEP